MAKSTTVKEKILQKAKGALWSKKDEALCREIMKNQMFVGQDGELSQAEAMEMLALLLNSCRNSLMRVRNRSKPSYYNKPHQFSHRHEMITEIIQLSEFLNEWVNQYQKYKEKRRMDNRPTLGRIDHEQGYTLDNIEVQAYSNNAAHRAEERFSKQCIALVANKVDMTGILFECPSATNALARINEVLDLGITKGMLHGNLDKGLTRVDNNYSVFIVSRDKLLEAPIVIDMGFLAHHVLDDSSVRLVALPEVSESGQSKVSIQMDDLGIIYVDFVEAIAEEDAVYEEIKNTKMKEVMTYE